MNYFRRFRHTIFEIALTVRFLNGIVETFLGLFAFVLGKAAMNNIFFHATRGELLEDPNDVIVQFFSRYVSDLSISTFHFAALYILVHGILNIFLCVELFLGKIWAYTATILFMSLIIFYEMYRFFYSHSIVLIALIAFDCFLVFLTWQEYQFHRKRVNSPLSNIRS